MSMWNHDADPADFLPINDRVEMFKVNNSQNSLPLKVNGTWSSLRVFHHKAPGSIATPFPVDMTQQHWPSQIQSNPVNTVTEGAIESVLINGVSVLSGLNLEQM